MPLATRPPAIASSPIAARKAALRRIVDALTDASASQLAFRVATIRKPQYLYKLADPNARNHPKPAHLLEAARVARTFARQLVDAAAEAEQIAQATAEEE